MNRNGSTLVTEKTILDSFPIGLVVLSKDTRTYTFRLVSINEYALAYLCIPLDTKDTNSAFISATKSFKLYNINRCLDISLYDYIISKQKKEKKYESSIQSSTFIFANKIINIKILHYNQEHYLTIDTISDDLKIIRERLISSIRKNFLMTINHELKNYLCGLITTLEETKLQIEEKNFMKMAMSVLLIQKIVKLYIIFNKASLDEIRNIDLTLETKIDIYLILLRMQVKFTGIFVNKNIQLALFNPLKKIIVSTEKHYIKELFFVVFFFLYYKSSSNSSIMIDIDYNSTCTSCVITFINHNQSSNQLNDSHNTMNDDIKIIERQIRETVINHDILQFLLYTISKFLHYDIIIYYDNYSDNPNENANGAADHQGTGKKLLSLKLYDIMVANDDIPKINEDSKGMIYTKEEIKSHVSIFIEQIQLLSNRNCLSELQFEKKNTYSHLKNEEESIPKSIKTIKNNNKSPINFSNDNLYDTNQSNILLTPQFHHEQNLYKNLRKNLSLDNIDSSKYRNISSDERIDHPFNISDFDVSDEEQNSNNKDVLVNINENIVTIGKYQKLYSKFENSQLGSTNADETTICNIPIGEKIMNLGNIEEDSKKIIDHISNSLTSNCKCNDIAVVDDDQSIAKSIMQIIKRLNYDSDYFLDAKVFIEKIKSKLLCTCDKRIYKLILLDIYMSEWGGISTCKKISELIESKTIPPGVNIVFISGHKVSDLDFPKYGFVKGFYQKPVNKATILKILLQFYENTNY